MKKSTCLILLAGFIATSVFCQKKDVELKEYFLDAEFFLSKEFYPDALHDFMEIYKRGYQDNANINYKIGICYLNIVGQKDKSIEYLKKASLSVSLKYKESKLDENISPYDVFLYLGNAYRINNMLDKAVEAYNKFKELLPKDEITLLEYANKEIEACSIAKEFMRKPLNVSFVNLGHKINTNSDESRAVVSGDGSVLIYMHRLPFYDAVYFSKKVKDQWASPENITPEIMSDGDQYASSVSYDGKTLFLSKEEEFNSDIYVSYYINNRWTKSVPLNSEINTKYWESHASISKDGKSLYFTSNRKGGYGNMDIYVSKLISEGKWGPARNLGRQINTEFNEETPFITDNDSILYFSSQGFSNMGGYDVFVSHKLADTAWSVPENVGYPISTTDDDLFFYPWNNGKYGYMSRIDSGGYGGTDIYMIVFNVLIKEELAKKEENAPVEKVKLSDTAGNISIAPGTSIVAASQQTKTDKTETKAVSKPDTSAKSIPPKIPIPEMHAKTYTISPIFFEFDRSQVSANGKVELNKLVSLMKEFADLNVVLKGFADALGPDDYNLRLSERRAIETLNYLESKGINATRLKAIGKGETDFLAPNTNQDGSDNPEGRKLNRRVEFEISGYNEDVLIIKRLDPVPKANPVQNK